MNRYYNTSFENLLPMWKYKSASIYAVKEMIRHIVGFLNGRYYHFSAGYLRNYQGENTECFTLTNFDKAHRAGEQIFTFRSTTFL